MASRDLTPARQRSPRAARGPPDPARARAPLVGRTVERSAVHDRVRGVQHGRPLVVWIEADAGSGTSALVDALVGELPPEFGVLRAEADELAVDEPLALAVQLGALGSGARPGSRCCGGDLRCRRRARSRPSSRTCTGRTRTPGSRCSPPSAGWAGTGSSCWWPPRGCTPHHGTPSGSGARSTSVRGRERTGAQRRDQTPDDGVSGQPTMRLDRGGA